MQNFRQLWRNCLYTEHLQILRMSIIVGLINQLNDLTKNNAILTNQARTHLAHKTILRNKELTVELLKMQTRESLHFITETHNHSYTRYSSLRAREHTCLFGSLDRSADRNAIAMK